jgi:hypothetical protein
MKISLGGRYTIDEFGEALSRVLQTISHNGIDEVLYANLYLTLHKDKRSVELLDEHGQVIDHLKFDNPQVSHFRRNSTGVRVVRSPTARLKNPDVGGAK